MSRRRWLFTIYAVALAASHTVRWVHPIEFPPGDLYVRNAGVRIAYYDSDPLSTQPVVLLLHGSPGSQRAVRGLAALLNDEFRVIAPDLPGFGASEHRLNDYSFRAHSRYLVRLLETLGIDRVHVAGFSMGGGVALSLVDLARPRVCTTSMISALGVQEEELLGNYAANHLLHGVQLAALAAARYGIPHFGQFDGNGLNVEYARNFFDSDQRPLRGILERYRGPMLILHGKLDRNVPLSAALAHHRLVPQSRLALFDGNHFLIFEHPEVVAKPLKEFLRENPCER